VTERERELAGGNASGRVVRVGTTVRKPWTRSSPLAQAYVTELLSRGIDAPRPMGRDERGRQVIEYVPGALAQDRVPLADAELRRVGAMIRGIHDASEGIPFPDSARAGALLPAEGADLLCHNDLAPWNLVTGEERWVFIDWDGAGPSTRLWDLAYAAQAFGMLVGGEPVEDAARRLSAVVDGYGADEGLRAALPPAMSRRTAAMFELLRSSSETAFEPWATMYRAGHGEHWRAAADYVVAHEADWARALSAPVAGGVRPAERRR
jgi:Ser/Thr protein kinase RdoA (MazF antagonist)